MTPPEILLAAGHPLRWRLLGELARGDRAVHELTTLVGEKQSLVSYHLGQLRQAGLLRSRRSSADARDTYYTLDLRRCAQLLADTGGALHPGLRLVPPPSPSPSPSPSLSPAPSPVRVLFVCSGNSARSQLAEALLRQRCGWLTVASAGIRPRPVHPLAVATLAARGIDISRARSKVIDPAETFDHVITLCDRAREACPELPGHPVTAHWSIPDPGDDPAAFVALADELTERIDFLIHLLAETPLVATPAAARPAAAP